MHTATAVIAIPGSIRSANGAAAAELGEMVLATGCSTTSTVEPVEPLLEAELGFVESEPPVMGIKTVSDGMSVTTIVDPVVEVDSGSLAVDEDAGFVEFVPPVCGISLVACATLSGAAQ